MDEAYKQEEGAPVCSTLLDDFARAGKPITYVGK